MFSAVHSLWIHKWCARGVGGPRSETLMKIIGHIKVYISKSRNLGALCVIFDMLSRERHELEAET